MSCSTSSVIRTSSGTESESCITASLYAVHDFARRRPLLILDREKHVIAVFVGAPEDPEWPEVVANAVAAMKKAREEGLRTKAFAGADALHRRGRYYTITGGVSYGGGQKVA